MDKRRISYGNSQNRTLFLRNSNSAYDQLHLIEMKMVKIHTSHRWKIFRRKRRRHRYSKSNFTCHFLAGYTPKIARGGEGKKFFTVRPIKSPSRGRESGNDGGGEDEGRFSDWISLQIVFRCEGVMIAKIASTGKSSPRARERARDIWNFHRMNIYLLRDLNIELSAEADSFLNCGAPLI